MKTFILLLFTIAFTTDVFSQISEKHNISSFDDSIFPKQINEYSIRYDSNENPIDSVLRYKLFYNKYGELIEKQYRFKGILHISEIYDTVWPNKLISIKNPYPKTPMISTGVARGLDTEIIEYNGYSQLSCHVIKYRNLEHKRTFNFYNSENKITEQKIYWNFKLTKSTFVQYIY